VAPVSPSDRGFGQAPPLRSGSGASLTVVPGATYGFPNGEMTSAQRCSRTIRSQIAAQRGSSALSKPGASSWRSATVRSSPHRRPASLDHAPADPQRGVTLRSEREPGYSRGTPVIPSGMLSPASFNRLGATSPNTPMGRALEPIKSSEQKTTGTGFKV
jgi:hypothetical protein